MQERVIKEIQNEVLNLQRDEWHSLHGETGDNDGKSLRFNGAICIECYRWYSLAELEEIDETEIVPCGHAWTGLFDTIEEEAQKPYDAACQDE